MTNKKFNLLKEYCQFFIIHINTINGSKITSGKINLNPLNLHVHLDLFRNNLFEFALLNNIILYLKINCLSKINTIT